MNREPWRHAPSGASSSDVFAASERFTPRAQRRSLHRDGFSGAVFSVRPPGAARAKGGRAPAVEAEERPMNTHRNTVLLALRTARPWFEGSWPKPHEVDATVRRARKALIESRNGLTKERAHPTLVVAVFDQVSHALSRFAVPSANGELIVRELAANAGRASAGAAVEGASRAQAMEDLIEEAAFVLVEVASGEERAADPSASQWLLNVAAELVRHDRSAAARAAGIEVQKAARSDDSARANSKSKLEDVPVVNKSSPLIDTLKTDATDAAWRTAGSQFVKLTREPLVGLLTRHLAPGDDAFRAKIAAFLETELGAALVASMLAAALSAMPATAGEVPQKLARELRVRAMADAGDVMADLLMGPLRQVISLYLQDPAGAAPTIASLPEGVSESLEDTHVRERVGVVR
jgi:hypothetical protein